MCFFVFQEFKACVPILKEWNVNVRDASATFKTIDENNGGMVLFNEFAAWAIKQCNPISGNLFSFHFFVFLMSEIF